MSDIATIKVMYKPGKYEMVINESDFDDKIHEKIGEKKPTKSSKKENTDDDVKALLGEE